MMALLEGILEFGYERLNFDPIPFQLLCGAGQQSGADVELLAE
jgi:hypothetical protein